MRVHGVTSIYLSGDQQSCWRSHASSPFLWLEWNLILTTRVAPTPTMRTTAEGPTTVGAVLASMLCSSVFGKILALQPRRDVASPSSASIHCCAVSGGCCPGFFSLNTPVDGPWHLSRETCMYPAHPGCKTLPCKPPCMPSQVHGGRYPGTSKRGRGHPALQKRDARRRCAGRDAGTIWLAICLFNSGRSGVYSCSVPASSSEQQQLDSR